MKKVPIYEDMDVEIHVLDFIHQAPRFWTTGEAAVDAQGLKNRVSTILPNFLNFHFTQK
jgi:hypothetical protein